MRIGELARRTGVSVRMLRYYEQEGLLAPRRRPSGYRDYGAADERSVGRIRLLGEAGLRLDAIKRLLPCVTTDRPDFRPCPDLVATLEREMAEMDRKIANLAASRRMLAGFLERLS
jgi:Predicted transcriptional regulators